MAPRGTKRPVTLSDAFRLEEEDQIAPRDAKLSRNLGAQTSGQQADVRQQQGGMMFWQQQVNAQKPSDFSRHDGSSSILSTPVAGLPGAEETELPAAPSRRPEKAAAERPTAASASPPAAQRQRSTGSGSETPKAAKATGFFVCWLCKRKFETYDGFDSHVLYSRLHQETIRQLAGIA
eukprot:TRINITY_DN71161_c0_g1_i1.p1 TRINITY_DN71161_c0_g1~~TRINITY_DN71161_c0_g1_i1.p1  ORF type:complete len:178 (-),score=39.28 TRINITY_DN71161_c0_g1_i1:4-537(-)